jgi:uncharacterized membrane protein
MEIGILIFKFVSYGVLAILFDSIFNLIASWGDGEITENDKFLFTHFAFTQTLGYILFFMTIFEFLNPLIAGWFVLFRYVFWGILLVGMEFLFGLLMDKVFHKRLWNFTGIPGNILGYTIWYLAFLWGFVGIAVGWYSDLVIYLAPLFVEFNANYGWMRFLGL